MPVALPDNQGQTISDNDIATEYKGRLTSGALFVESVKQGFEFTTVGAALSGSERERSARRAEKEAFGEDYIPYREQMAGDIGSLSDLLPPDKQEVPTMSKEEWSGSQFYRKGLDWEEGLTEARAQVYAETFDKRKAKNDLLDKNADTFGRKALFFGGNIVGNLPDPINLIPGVKAAQVAKGATAVTKGALKSAAATGFVEAAALTAVTDAAVIPVLQDLGDDVGIMDAIFDVTIGGLFGAITKPIGVVFDVRKARQAASLDNAKAANNVTQKAVSDINDGELPDVAEVIANNPTKLPKGYEFDENTNFSKAADFEGMDTHSALLDESEKQMNILRAKDEVSSLEEYGLQPIETERVFAEVEVTAEDGTVTRSVQDVTDQITTEANEYIARYEKGLDAAIDCIIGV